MHHTPQQGYYAMCHDLMSGKFKNPVFSWLTEFLYDKMDEYIFKGFGVCIPQNGDQLLKERICSPWSKFLSRAASHPFPLEMVTLLRKTTGIHNSRFPFLEAAQPSPSLCPLQYRTNSKMITIPEPFLNHAELPNFRSTLDIRPRRVSTRCLDNVDPSFRYSNDVWPMP